MLVAVVELARVLDEQMIAFSSLSPLTQLNG